MGSKPRDLLVLDSLFTDIVRVFGRALLFIYRSYALVF